MIQSTSNVLCVSPDAFAWSHETAVDNKFMPAISSSSTDERAQQLKAIQTDHARWVNVLRALGINVVLFGHDASTPDAVFPNNWFSTHRTQNGQRAFCLFPMKAPSRRLERRPEVVAELRKLYPDAMLDLTMYEERNMFFEGTGSAVVDWLNCVVYVALSQRSHIEPATAWTKWLSGFYGREFELLTFHAQHNGADVYHTNVLLSIGTAYCVVCLEVITSADDALKVRNRLQSTGRSVVVINSTQMSHFCGNVLELADHGGKRVYVMSNQAWKAFDSAQLCEIERSATVVHEPLDTLELLGGGGIRCCIAELF
jgi:hypothetical protein